MNLHRQKRKEYNVFNIEGEEEIEGIMMLQFTDNASMEPEESEFDRLDAKYMLLTESLD